MYPDEVRPEELLHNHRGEEQTLASQGAGEPLAQLGSTTWSDERDALAAERDDLKRRLHDSFTALQQERSKNEVLQADIEALKQKLRDLRGSKTMRAGKAVTSPLRAARTVVRDPRRVQDAFERRTRTAMVGTRSRLSSAAGAFARLKREGSAGRDSSMLATGSSTAAQQAITNGNDNRREGKARGGSEFERTLNTLWYRNGSIDQAQAHIERHYGDLAPEEVSEKCRILVGRVKGAYRLKKAGWVVPPRSERSAYLVEPGRVMYTVHSTPVYNSNGYSTRTRGVAKGLAAAGRDVVVVARTGYPWDSAVDSSKPGQLRDARTLDGVLYVHTPGGNLNRDPFDTYVHQAADAFVREALLNRPAFIQSASNYRTALPALIAARRVGVPFIYEVRGLWELTEASSKAGFENTERFQLMADLETLVASEADMVLAITRQVAEELTRRGVDESKIRLAPNAVDVDYFMPIPKDLNYAQAKKLEDVPTIGFAGSFAPYEGLNLLLEASLILTTQGFEHQIVLAGSGAAEESLKQQAAEHGMKNVHFLGRLPQNEIPRVLSTFDVVALPRVSTLITELVSPLKPLESFAAGRATVLSDVAPHRDLAGESGIRAALFEAGNAESMAATLKSVLLDADRRAEYTRHARLWAVRERTWQSLGRSMVEAQHMAAANYATAASDKKSMSDVKVGVIADEFTRTTLAGVFDTVPISRQNWETQLEENDLDLLFVESAWEGNEGEWRRGIGFYSAEESADLDALLHAAAQKGIPTVFWNKEDPVHFARFAPTAAKFDHVFTTDANMIPKYAATANQRNSTISAMPFFAEPGIHNPLPTDKPFRDSFAYAGTYYGQRFANRSRGLDALLEEATKFSLDIYDRQAAFPDSPYKFPARYASSVRGALPYDEVIKSYGTHIAHLNVNSVTDSPTMFSRRVVEIPASGGIVLSSGCRGISESLGTNIPALDEHAAQRTMMRVWATNPQGRLDEVWRQMRTIYRSHTADTALSILCRTVGIPTGGIALPTLAVTVGHLDLPTAEEIAAQSYRPDVVETSDAEPDAVERLNSQGIIVDSAAAHGGELLVAWSPGKPRTWLEDLLLPYRFGTWDYVHELDAGSWDGRQAVVNATEESAAGAVLVNRADRGGIGVGITLPVVPAATAKEFLPFGEAGRPVSPKTIVVAGHDLKFAGGFLRQLESDGHRVVIDQWESHTKHDEEASYAALAEADVIFCEWGLGNAAWYSKNLREGQRLVVRIHSQELFRPFLRQINHAKVDGYIFVGDLIRDAAVRSHGVISTKSVVIPNPVDVEALDIPKSEDSEWGIGMVGIVPRAKRLDLAIDVIERLLAVDPRFHLRIKGKLPEDYPWMKNRPEEMEYYRRQMVRIDRLNARTPGAVRFDGFGDDMPAWYSKVATVISVSDFESFHLTLADGAASGAFPVSLAWPGADRIYPSSWLVSSTEEMAQKIGDRVGQELPQDEYRSFVIEHFAEESVLHALVEVTLG